MERRLKDLKVGLVDADLLDGGTRHPNLALLKIAGLLHDNDIYFELIEDGNADISSFDYIYISKVFTFTKEPAFFLNAKEDEKKKFRLGGTGYYATETNIGIFKKKRDEDMARLGHDPFLSSLPNKYGIPEHPRGILMHRQMPYYDLYKKYVAGKIGEEKPEDVEWRKRRLKYKDYLDYSIGFLTRGCVRHCPFCINKLESRVVENSKLEWFYDSSRPHVYFWDDNFLAAPRNIWHPILKALIDKKISFQFRQGLDERQFAQNPDGEEMARMLAQARYHGDFIFAFDNWRDKDVVVRALKIWKRYNPNHPTKFYLFCGFMQHGNALEKFYKDILELFQRIKVLMMYGCIGYVMRHEDYHHAPIPNFYVQMARWCNQPAFYKKMSFWQYCYRNQSYWEQTVLKKNCRDHLSFDGFLNRKKSGYYEKGKMKLCLPLRTILAILEMFPDHRDELLAMFNYRYLNLRDPKNWEE